MTDHTKIRLLDALTGALILIAAGSGILIILKIVDIKDNAAGLESLAQVVAVSEDERSEIGNRSPEDAGDTDEADAAGISIALRKKQQEKYALLKEENPDMMGWLSIEETRINYPVTQSVDRPNFYLKHNFAGDKSSFGNPYLAESCDMNGTPANLIIYGHHMKDGSMFAGLMKYTDEKYYREHPVIRFDTLTELGDYQVIGAFCPSANEKDGELYRNMQALNRTEYEAYVAEVSRRTYYDTGITASYGDQLLTLITCEYSQDNGRMVIVARKME